MTRKAIRLDATFQPHHSRHDVAEKETDALVPGNL